MEPEPERTLGLECLLDVLTSTSEVVVFWSLTVPSTPLPLSGEEVGVDEDEETMLVLLGVLFVFDSEVVSLLLVSTSRRWLAGANIKCITIRLD